jgi:hypothetical protein
MIGLMLILAANANKHLNFFLPNEGHVPTAIEVWMIFCIWSTFSFKMGPGCWVLIRTIFHISQRQWKEPWGYTNIILKVLGFYVMRAA